MKHAVIFTFIILLAPSLVACQSAGKKHEHKIEYLMPAPVAITEDAVNPLTVRDLLAPSNRVEFFYATNRKAAEPGDPQHYIVDFDQSVRVGQASVRIGHEQHGTDAIFSEAISPRRKEKIPLFLEKVDQHAVIDGSGPEMLTGETLSWLGKINEAIRQSPDKDLTVYVHGANNTFYRSCAQAGQFRYFSGRESTVLVYAWPSSGSILHYGVDVENSAKSYMAFARLIHILARHTEARHINILAYSAGARVASPALSHLANAQTDNLRLGIVYYAEPDEYQGAFFNHLADYLHLTKNTTLTVNFHDSVLALAETYNMKPDAGMPDFSKLSDVEKKEIAGLVHRENFTVIDIDGSRIPGLPRGDHGAWYNHPWINSDVITQFLFRANHPRQRGLMLKTAETPDVLRKLWIYPADYPQRIKRAMPELIEKGQ